MNTECNLDLNADLPPDFLQKYRRQGQILSIITYPHPTLKKQATAVTDFNPALRHLCRDLLFTMYAAPGLGLAAPQVNIRQRIFVCDTTYEREEKVLPSGETTIKLKNFKPQVFINPIITPISEEMMVHEEGCLSVPQVFEDVKRHKDIKIVYQDPWGNRHEEELHELAAICAQHEFDHLEGHIFLERLGLLKRQLALKKYLKQQKASAAHH
ncbi:MAG: peptide deformylase [Bacteriovoracaceae bacterium]|nr:peptide deformylase [Bacteriovoracaceae bacterium]